MATNVIDRDLGLQAFIRELQEAKTAEVVVGILEGTMNKDATVAEYAAANEYGTSKIPERPFMRTSFDVNVGYIYQDMQAGMESVKDKTSTVRGALALIGMKHVRRVKLQIASNIQPANSPKTIARKKSSRTLIDTAAMINGVNYLVRAKTTDPVNK